MKLILCFLICASIPYVLFSTSAEGKLSDDIGVQLSKTCVVMIKNNLTTNCPTYEEILFLFPDTSDQRISGRFVFEGGYLHRAASDFENPIGFYRYQEDNHFWVNPPADISERIKLITIESRLDEYKIGNQVITNSSVQVGYKRWVSDDCRSVTLAATDWQVLLGDTVRYVGSDCHPEFTSFDSVKTKTWERVVHDITTSYKYQLDNWYRQAIEKCGQRICFYEHD